jgi:hypothetical protein
MATVHTLIANLKCSTSAFDKGIKRAGKTLSGFGATAASVGSGIVKGFGMLGAAAIGAGVALAFPIKNAMQSIDELAKMSDSLGLSTEALGGLKHAAGLSGVELNTLADGMGEMQKKLAEAKEGSEGSIQAFKRLGIDAKTMGGTTEEQFYRIADAIKALPQSQKILAVDQIMGGAGKQLLPLLAQGSEGLKAMQAEAESLGLTFSRFEAGQIEAANDSITRLKGLLQGVVQHLAIGLAPYIEYVSDYFINLGSEGGRATDWISDKMKYLVNVIGWAVKGVNLLKSAFNFVAGSIYKGVEWILKGFEKLFGLMAKGADLLKMDGLAESLRTAGTFSEAFAEGFNELASDKFSKAGEQFSKAFAEDTAKNVLDQIEKNKAEIKLSLGKTPFSGETFDTDTEAAKKSGKASAMEFRSRYIDVKALAKGGLQSPEEKAIREDVAANRQTAINTAKLLSQIGHLALA